ncbi:MAG: MBOAT family O-acyltransferase [Bacteroidota bacterium]
MEIDIFTISIDKMFFHDLIFIFLFLPLSVFLYYISGKTARKYTLLLVSVIFTAWFNIYLTAVLFGSAVVNYFAAKAMKHSSSASRERVLFITTITFNLLLLSAFKYFGFFSGLLNQLFSIAENGRPLIKTWVIPVGISFYTFRSISYLISVKRGEVKAERSFINLAVYISLFPQLIAGPIDRYRNLISQIINPSVSVDQFSSGIRRFIIGLAKKVLIATPLAMVADGIFATPVGQLNAPLAWLGAIAYTLQIFYDFSGYTDMAIGIGKMIGMEFSENFNFPYIATSVKDFWKRWHITLSSWLRDYLFLPLAYARSKKMEKERYFHLKTDHWIYIYATIITFLICGFWHGAAWTFILWGFLHGIMLVLEQLGLGKWLKRSFRPLQHLYLLFFLLFSWVLFRSPSIPDAIHFAGVMMGAGEQIGPNSSVAEYLDLRTIVVLIIAILLATPVFEKIGGSFKGIINKNSGLVKQAGMNLYNSLGLIFLLILFAFSVMTIISGTSTPFIYFKF